ncbi:MAG: M20 family metallopeptidase [Lachnospiraceae bacterium]|nr:M20 family metallopeptidase [Lachnospiraceae bacterium]
MVYENIKEETEQLFSTLTAIRHALHENPENGTREYKTDTIITDCLKQWDIPFRFIADTGILAQIEGTGKAPASGSPVIGIRADIDALPITEPKEHPCCSRNPGMMHACGHDAHTAILLGTACLLQRHRSEWSGTVKCFFQPAEETVGGAKRMVEAGCMNDPAVDYVTGLHVMPQFPTGDVELKYGRLNASSDEIIINVTGVGCHGAYPENGIDSIVIASNLILSLQTLVSRNISPLNSAVLSFGKIQGGQAGNIICDQVTLTGTLRTLDPKTRTKAHTMIQQQCTHIAAAYGGKAELTIHSGYDALINSNELVELAALNAAELLGEEHIHWKEFPSLGVEDFSFFQHDAKASVFYHLGCTSPAKAPGAPLHSPQFELDDNCLKTGVLLQYHLTQKLLNYRQSL